MHPTAPAPSRSSRANAMQAAFNRVIRKITSEVEPGIIARAFVYASPDIIDVLVPQIQTLLTEYANEQWDRLRQDRSIMELCALFDELEAAALQHFNAGLAPHHLTRDPQLSIPPLVLQLIDPLLSHIRSVTADQRRKNEALHAHVLKQAAEADRLEKDITDRLADMKMSIEEIESVMSRS